MERRNLNAWEDEAVHSAVKATGRKRLVIAGFLTEATSRRRLRQLALERAHDCNADFRVGVEGKPRLFGMKYSALAEKQF